MKKNNLPGLKSDFEERNTPIPSHVDEVDIEEYRAELGDYDISEKQKTEFLLSLAHSMHMIARMGIEFDVCGRIFADENEASVQMKDDDRIDPSSNAEKPSRANGKGKQ